jgi:methylated-DNA-protein-cysteine methyltransferase-like protein
MKDDLIQQDFFERVYEVVRLIPYGRVSSYGAIGKFLGSGRSARMVGWAMNHSHKGNLEVPAHRVVNRNGLLSGRHFFTQTPMEVLLEREGIPVVDYQIQNFKEYFWDPSLELAL